jgi:hypothetical protein
MTDFEEIGDRVAAYVPDDKTETEDIREYIEAQGLMSNNGQSVGRRTVERTAASIAAGRETPEPDVDPNVVDPDDVDPETARQVQEDVQRGVEFAEELGL